MRILIPVTALALSLLGACAREENNADEAGTAPPQVEQQAAATEASKAFTADFTLTFPDQMAASRFAEKLFGQSFNLAAVEGEAGKWSVKATKSKLSADDIIKIKQQLTDLAKAEGGEFGSYHASAGS